MPKNIVVCCDGTGNEFGAANSNVVKLYRVLDLSDPAQQVAYYHPGVGTMGEPQALLRITKWLTRLLGMAFGYGLTRNIGDAYTFLMNEYQPGDRVFVFGFSRGAFTARALCGMLHKFGLISKGNDALVAYAARMYKSAPKEKVIAEQFKETFSTSCRPHFLGVWDTVSSVGWITDPVHLPFTASNPDLQTARHAISIDERRCFYRQNLLIPWRDVQPPQDIEQVWFPGVHSDVGGSYPEPEGGLRLPSLSLRWMLGEAVAAGLRVDDQQVRSVLGNEQDALRLDPKVEPHNSLKGGWLLFEILPHRYQKKVTGADGKPLWVTRWRISPGKRRYIEDGALVHASVEQLRKLGIGYDPPNLPRQLTFVDHRGSAGEPVRPPGP